MQTDTEATVTLLVMFDQDTAAEVRKTLGAWERYGKTGTLELGAQPVRAELGTSEELLANVNQLIRLWWDLRHLAR